MSLVNIIPKFKKYKENYKKKNSKFDAYLIVMVVSASMIVAELPRLFEGETIANIKGVTDHGFLTLAIMIGMSILVYSIVDKFLDNHDHSVTSKQLDEKLHLIKSMIETKGLETIVTSDEITNVENNSDEIIMILDNLYLDLPLKDKAVFEGELHDFGTFFEPVHENIKAGKQYTYYLKYDNNTHSTIKLHMAAHFNALKKDNNIKEPIFILIPSNEFSFFSDIYIYKDNIRNRKSAYEWLPTLTKDKTLFYLQFDINQTNKLEHILTTTKQKYGITYGSTLEENEKYIVDTTFISAIEKVSEKIQIITDDLKEDLEGGAFFEAVKMNLLNNKKYTYFLPDNKNIMTMIQQYKKDHQLSPNIDNVSFICIPDKMFFFFNNIYIYDEKQAFEFIPASKLYFKYDNTQLKKLSLSLNSLNIKPLDIDFL